MKYGALSYSTLNIGDDIQTVAAMRLLPRVDFLIDRDQLDKFSCSEEVLLIMGGWFSDRPEAWPPSPAIRPIFVAFHMTSQSAAIYDQHRRYFIEHGPIGCRDRGTAAYFADWNVPAFVSYCLTLTLPRRERAPKHGKVAIVDAGNIAIPDTLRRGATTVQFSHLVAPVSPKTRLAYAQELLDFYRDEVNLVITTRLHCALPCMAMGVPVVYFGRPNSTRESIVKEVGGRIHSKYLHRRSFGGLPGRLLDAVDWSPGQIDLGPVPKGIEQAVREKIDSITGSFPR